MDIVLQLSDSEQIFLGGIPLDAIDEAALSVTGRSELTDFFKIVGQSEIMGLPERYRRLCENLDLTGSEALQVVPQARLKAHLKEAVCALQDVLYVKEDAEYLVTYLSIKRFLQELQRICVDGRALTRLIDATDHETTRSSLDSFMPDASGYAGPIQYSTTNTVTGRMTVKSGPQILTAPAEARKCFKSRYVNGKVLQIDIISVEPKFALHVGGKRPPKDVYSHIAKVILENKVTRSQAKLITLCALYGQSARKLAQGLPDDANARRVINRTRQFFDSECLESRLKSERRNGVIRNVVGRPIRLPGDDSHLLISYYLQSSAAEGAILMFSRFIQATDLTCVPLGVIHDALILDCDEKSAQRLLSDDNFKLFLGDWVFDAVIKHVGE
jgi:hypothetical protein